MSSRYKLQQITSAKSMQWDPVLQKSHKQIINKQTLHVYVTDLKLLQWISGACKPCYQEDWLGWCLIKEFRTIMSKMGSLSQVWKPTEKPYEMEVKKIRLFVCFLFFFFSDRVSWYSPGCPGTHSVDQAGFKLRNRPASATRVLGLKACTTTAWLL